MNSQLIKKLEIKFETASEIPPPFCHYYHFNLTLENNKWLCSFQWKYHNRSGLTIEEIYDEGFTGEDDFEWNGELNQKIITEVLLSLNNISLLPEKDNIPLQRNYLFFLITDSKEINQEGVPKNQKEWEYLIQEIIQGIYEISGKERPLEVSYRRNMTGGKFEKIKLKVSFSEREISALIESDRKEENLLKNIPWKEGQEIISQIFNLDFNEDSEDNTDIEPDKKSGSFIEVGDGVWFEMGKSVRNFSKKRDDILVLEKIFSDLIR